jgi:hypothetical protein
MGRSAYVESRARTDRRGLNRPPPAVAVFPAATVVVMSQGTAASAGDERPQSTRAALGSWLDGPKIEAADDQWSYKGERLGLPETGPGSLAGQGSRLGALFVDWALAYLAAYAFGWHPSTVAGEWGTIALFAGEQLVLLSTLGYTIGKRLFGLRVGRLGAALTPVHVAVRTVLLLLVIPAVIWDRDGRGMHDRLALTVVVRR